MIKDFRYVQGVLKPGAIVDTVHICGDRVLIHFIDPTTGAWTIAWVPRKEMTITTIPEGDVDIASQRIDNKNVLTLVAKDGKLLNEIEPRVDDTFKPEKDVKLSGNRIMVKSRWYKVVDFSLLIFCFLLLFFSGKNPSISCDYTMGMMPGVILSSFFFGTIGFLLMVFDLLTNMYNTWYYSAVIGLVLFISVIVTHSYCV